MRISDIILLVSNEFEIKHSESHRFTEDGFDKNNGANGKLPITPKEWRLVGISSDMDAYRLMKYIYGFQLNLIFEFHEGTVRELYACTRAFHADPHCRKVSAARGD